ncbi:MAG: putative F420-0 ABC transporter substrate-binding protein [Pseudolysinimonas sp.]|uniref:putative F420-0 ABC transporter substrate-binding protein n=1 Tax=Pseudolysinimonas sp. TaxID=2680009 RepID=UPI0032677BAC
MTVRRPFAFVAVATVLVLAACTTPAAIPTNSPTTSGPVTVENCGVAVTFATPPQRVITIKSTSTEMMLALGVGDRIVGTAYQDGPVPDEWASGAAAIPVLADKMPSEEVVLNAEPDLVYSGWESAFAPDAAGNRAELQSLGVATYVQPAACQSADQPAKLSFDEIFREIAEAAKIFDVDPTALLEQQKTKLDAIHPASGNLTALWWSSGKDTPYVGAGIGAPELLLETAGLTNIAGDINMTWSPLGWESILAADPDVIVLVDASWNTAGHKIEYLTSNPATANLTAVKNSRYIVIPFAASEAGVRSVDAAASIADQLKTLKLP